MFESLRSFGYSLEAAIADLVDNSISAGARNVWIDFHWAGLGSTITILDDGKGMTEVELRNAMTPASASPLEERDKADLGRFGLGMKTASVSQCRLLTVASRRAHRKPATRTWDLDYIGKVQKWRLLHAPRAETLPFLGALDAVDQGTLVVWQRCDRLVQNAHEGNEQEKGHFLGRFRTVQDHLAMIFHRYLGRNLHLWIKGNKIEPWDPFLTNEPATQELSQEALDIFGKRLHLLPYVLPHESKLSAASLHEGAAGPKGWNAQQGFYLYRNKRLIVPGTWLDLGFKQEPHCALARILIDLPNTLDHEWQIDVKKSTATPPPSLINPLKRIARITRTRATDVYRNRGNVVRRTHARDFELVWQRVDRHNKHVYRVNRNHALLKQIIKDHPGIRDDILALVEMIENTLPVMQIILDSQQEPESVRAADDWESMKKLEDRGLRLYEALRHEGKRHDEAMKMVLLIEPFDRMPSLVAKLEQKGKEKRYG